MTVPALFGYGGHSTFRSSTIPPSASDRGDSWKLGGGSGGWHTHNNKGGSSAAMSALTLLVFLFFLNILHSCLQDMTFNHQPPPIVQVVSAPSAMREDRVTMMPMPVMIPMMTTPPSKRSGRNKRGDPRELTLVRKQFVQLPALPSHPKSPVPPIRRFENPIAAAVISQRLQLQASRATERPSALPTFPSVVPTPPPVVPTPPPVVPTTTERRFIPVPLVSPGHSIEDRDEVVEESGGDYVDDPTPASPVAPNIILVRPIVPIAASFRQLAWRAINAISRPLMPLLTLWKSGRGEDGGASSELCCSMLMCELERIRERGGVFRIRLAQLLRGLTAWSCPTDSSLYHENSDCGALITECLERTGRHTTFTTLASFLERFVP